MCWMQVGVSAATGSWIVRRLKAVERLSALYACSANFDCAKLSLGSGSIMESGSGSMSMSATEKRTEGGVSKFGGVTMGWLVRNAWVKYVTLFNENKAVADLYSNEGDEGGEVDVGGLGQVGDAVGSGCSMMGKRGQSYQGFKNEYKFPE